MLVQLQSGALVAESLCSTVKDPLYFSSTRHGVHPLTDTPDSSTLIRTTLSQGVKSGLSPLSGTTGFLIKDNQFSLQEKKGGALPPTPTMPLSYTWCVHTPEKRGVADRYRREAHDRN